MPLQKELHGKVWLQASRVIQHKQYIPFNKAKFLNFVNTNSYAFLGQKLAITLPFLGLFTMNRCLCKAGTYRNSNLAP